MIKKLQLKFILTIMSIISLLIIIILISINLIMNNDMERKIKDSIRDIAIKEGMVNNRKPNFKPDHFFEPIRQPPNIGVSFSIKLDNYNNIIEVIVPENLNYTEDEILLILNYTLENDSEYGKYIDFAFFKMKKPYGQIIVFQDIANYNQTKENLIYISILVYIFSLIIVFIISYFLVKWIIKPVKQNFEMQKQFIANASHELKTPLAIISTNLSILKDEEDLSEQRVWIENTKDEVFKMNKLINELLILSKNETFLENKEKNELNLSDVLINAILPYESLAFEEKRVLKYDIIEDIFIKSYKEDIITIIRILLDNAIKYSKEDDIIEVKLKKENNKIQISVFNTGIGIKEEDRDKIFDRFYRVDTSRNKEIEGYGLGLSIAKKIIENNKWKILIEGEYNKWIKFIVEI